MPEPSLEPPAGRESQEAKNLRLTGEKLELELRDLRLRWYLRIFINPQALTALIAAAGAGFGVYLLINENYFKISEQINKLHIEELKIEAAAIKQERENAARDKVSAAGDRKAAAVDKKSAESDKRDALATKREAERIRLEAKKDVAIANAEKKSVYDELRSAQRATEADKLVERGLGREAREVALAAWRLKVTAASRQAVVDSYSLPLFQLATEKFGILMSSFSPDGRRVVGGCTDSHARVWDAKTGEVLVTLGNQPTNSDIRSSINDPRFTLDGKWIVGSKSGLLDRSVVVWDATTGQELHRPFQAVNKYGRVVISPTGTRLVVVNPSDPTTLWDIESGKVVAPLVEAGESARVTLFAPDGKTIFVAGSDKIARIWNAVTGKLLANLGKMANFVTSAAYSADGYRVVMASDDGAVWIRETATHSRLHKLIPHEGGISSVSFAPDGKRVLGIGRSVRVWDAVTGKQLVEMAAGEVGVLDGGLFSPDGRMVMTFGGSGGKVWVWDATTGKELVELRGAGRWASFSPDGRRVLSGAGIYKIVSAADVEAVVKAEE